MFGFYKIYVLQGYIHGIIHITNGKLDLHAL